MYQPAKLHHSLNVPVRAISPLPTSNGQIALIRQLLAPVLICATISGYTSPLHAEENRMLEEIVITATKRAENLQDVPVSVIATSGRDIQEFAMTNAADVTANLPAITIASNPIGNFLFMRGIGTPGANQGIEQSVSIFHDGIYMGRHQLSRAPFMDLQRVEVLRGPQSILFGKNTIGGAVHAISAKPTEEFEGNIGALYGWEDGEQEITAVISGGLTDSIRGRLAYRSYELDGYLENVLTGSDAPQRDDWSLRGQLEFDVSDTVTVNTKWETSEFFTGEKGIQLSIINPFDDPLNPLVLAEELNALNELLLPASLGYSDRLDDQVAAINDGGQALASARSEFTGLPGFPDLREQSDNEVNFGSINIDWDMGTHAFTSLTGFATYEYRDICDCDFSALPLIQVDADEDYEQISQEFRISSPLGQLVDYTVGLYYQKSNLEFNSTESIGTTIAWDLLPTPLPNPLLLPNLSREYTFRQDQEMLALFGSATLNIDESTRLTMGLRYFEEDKEASHVLHKRLTDGWNYGPVPSSGPYGATPEEYDRLVEGPDAGLGAITENIFASLLGTTEHNIQNRKREEEGLDWSLTFEKDLADDVLGFATISTGTKGGGFDARFLRADDHPAFEYEEEEATNYEAGIKATVLDGAMTINATYFLTQVEDYQVSIFDGATAFLVSNAGEIESRGLELDINWLVTSNLTASFAGSILNAEYKQFPNAPCWAGTTANNRGNCSSRAPGSLQERDASGDTNLFSPDKSFNLTLDYTLPINLNYDARATLVTNYVAEHLVTADLDPIYARQPSYVTYDLRLAVSPFETNWELALLGKNLTDEEISVNSNDQPLVPGNGYAQLQRLRSYAVQGIYRF